jgi:ribosomal protein L7/L12
MNELLSDMPGWGWIGAALVIGFIVGRMSAGGGSGETPEQRRQTTETNLARLSPGARAGVDSALARRNKIEAVKIVRAELNTGLRDSKDVVDLIQAGQKILGG